MFICIYKISCKSNSLLNHCTIVSVFKICFKSTRTFWTISLRTLRSLRSLLSWCLCKILVLWKSFLIV
nr:MAG TPA: hypothetical protein [Bacteriophage sp.]